MKAVIISGIAGTAVIIAAVGYFFVAPFVETRANGEGTAIHSEGESSSGALAREQKQEQETEEQQEKHMEELKQAAMARHERWGLFAGEMRGMQSRRIYQIPRKKLTGGKG